MQEGVEASGRDWGLLARALGVGAVVSFASFYVLVFAGWAPRETSELVFPLSAIPFAVGLIGWSGVMMSGEAIETFSAELGLSENWTVENGRQAMALLVTFGFGGMVGAAIAGAPYGV